ncbi:MAG TPA: DegT/DnrJ/EryC1/StrS family aminotransferase [Planctomycetota bacterium]|jgi:perosamine synthetase
MSREQPSTVRERIPWAQPEIGALETQYVLEALKSSWISGGPFVDRLEADFARYCGVKFAAAVSNGTTAVHLAFLALDLKPGDEVIVPGFGFMAAANIALHMNLKPVFVEVDERTWCLDPHAFERAITPKTKAVVPVHTYGAVCAMDPILKIANDHSIAVVEDAAESFPSRYRGQISGTLGALGCFSFQATKTITTGEGGMVITHDPQLYERLCLFRSHGMKKRRYWHDVPGHNFRLTNMQAALGCAQLEGLPRVLEDRRRVHSAYINRLQGQKGIQLQNFEADVTAVLWAMACRLDPGAFSTDRDGVIEALSGIGIETRPGFYASSLQPLYAAHKLPICEDVSRTVISLPTFPSLRNEQIDFICDQLLKLRTGHL